MTKRLRNLSQKAFTGAMIFAAIAIFVVLRCLFELDIGLAVALALGVPSFAYAAVQFHVGNGTVDKLIELQHQMSTRRLDEAPHFMSDIIDLVHGAGRELLVFCDFPAYGAIADPPEYERYRAAVCDRANAEGTTVRMLCLDEDSRQRLAGESYQEAPRAHGRARFRGVEDLQRAVQRVNAEAEQNYFTGVDKHQTSLVMPLYFWVGDREAIFSMRRYSGERMVEVGFKTSDRPLLDAFRDIFNRYLEVDTDFELVRRDAE